MADEDDKGPPPPPLTVRMEHIIEEMSRKHREVYEFAVGPLTWLDLVEELCPGARCMSDVVDIKWRGIPVKKNLHPKGLEGILYYAERRIQPVDLAVGQVGR